MRSYGRYWMEVFRLPAISPERILRDMRINADAEQALSDAEHGQGVIFALPHMGNWEVAGAYVVARGIKFATVAERLKPESLFDMFLKFREGLGMEVLPLRRHERVRRARPAAARRPHGLPALRP